MPLASLSLVASPAAFRGDAQATNTVSSPQMVPTISRDLEQIGAVKVRRGGQLGYALPEQVPAPAGPRLAAVLRDFVRSIDSVPAATS